MSSNARIAATHRVSLRLYLVANKRPTIRNTLAYLGATKSEVRRFLEDSFTRVMNWGNYGAYWTVDHVYPLSCFDLTREDHRAVAFHYTNIQPLEAEANMRKGARYAG